MYSYTLKLFYYLYIIFIIIIIYYYLYIIYLYIFCMNERTNEQTAQLGWTVAVLSCVFSQVHGWGTEYCTSDVNPHSI